MQSTGFSKGLEAVRPLEALVTGLEALVPLVRGLEALEDGGWKAAEDEELVEALAPLVKGLEAVAPLVKGLEALVPLEWPALLPPPFFLFSKAFLLFSSILDN